MADTTTKLLVQFLADTREISGAVKNIEGTGDKLKGWAKGVAVSIAAAFAVDKIIDFTKQAVTAASDLEESTSKVGVVFGDQAQSILDWSKNSATAMGLSKQAALEAAGTYGNLAVALGLPQTQAADMSKTLVGLAGDLASFNNVPVEDALRALQSGLTGETEPLKKFGVNLNETTIKAEAMSSGLVEMVVNQEKLKTSQERVATATQKTAKAIAEHGAESEEAKKAAAAQTKAEAALAKVMEGKAPTLNAAQKAQAAYALILQQTGTAQGDFARTSEGLANQQRIASAQWEDMQATLGQALLPIITDLVGVLNDYLIPALTAVAGFVEQNSSWLFPLAAGIGAVVVAMKAWNAVTDVAETVQKSYTAAVKLFSAEGAIAKAATAAWTVVQAAFNLVMSANPIALVVIAIAALVAGIIIAYKNVEWFRDLVDAAFDAILAAVQFVWDWVKNNWPLLLAIITGPFGTAVLLIVKYWDQIKAAGAAVFDWIKSNWPLLLAIITGPFGLAVKLIVDNWDTIKGAVGAAYTWVKDKLGGLVDFVVGLPQKIARAALGMFDGIKVAFRAALNWVIRAWNGLEFNIPGFSLGPVSFGGFTLGMPDIPMLAKGGIVTSPTLAMIGERGPEAVLPLSALGGLGGGDATIDARVIVNGPVYGVDDLDAWADERDRRLASVLSAGRRP